MRMVFIADSLITLFTIFIVEDCEIVFHHYSHYWRLDIVLGVFVSLLVCWNATLEEACLCILDHDVISRLDVAIPQ
jgi:hypothetical protein